MKSLFCHERPKQIPHGCSFVKSDGSKLLTFAPLFRATWAIRSWLLFKKERLSKEWRERLALWHKKGKNCKKHTKKYYLFHVFLSELLVTKERLEQIAHGCSLVKSDLSDSLKVTLFSWATWADGHGRSLIWAILIQRAKSTNSQPCIRGSWMSVWIFQILPKVAVSRDFWATICSWIEPT